MRPGYETLDYRSLPYRHHSEMRRPQTITERLPNGWERTTIVDGADLEAARRQSSRGRVTQEERMSADLRRALNSSDPAVALRARKLQLLMLQG
jgi:hypothetical protein